MIIAKNIAIDTSGALPVYLDLFSDGNSSHPIVIYAHGFNGFKDWANFDLVAQQFAAAGFAFVKFNFSHNGTSGDQPEAFVNLEAYSNNNYSKELEDLGTVIDWCVDPGNPYSGEFDAKEVYLVGHSLGGGIVLLKAAEDSRIQKVATWAAVSECKTPWGTWPEERILEWQRSGFEYVVNSRTKQNLPLKYQLYEDFEANRRRLDIQMAIASLQIPILLCHGTRDESVPVQKAEDLKSWQPSAELFKVESDHVFGRKHPWNEAYLPDPMQAVVDKTIQFFKNGSRISIYVQKLSWR